MLSREKTYQVQSRASLEPLDLALVEGVSQGDFLINNSHRQHIKKNRMWTGESGHMQDSGVVVVDGILTTASVHGSTGTTQRQAGVPSETASTMTTASTGTETVQSNADRPWMMGMRRVLCSATCLVVFVAAITG